MRYNFKVIWNANTPIGTPTEIQGKCVICNSNINNFENHYSDQKETVRICLTCVSKLSTSYESIFNHKQEKTEK